MVVLHTSRFIRKMDYRELTDVEKKYLAEGGRVFIVGSKNELYIRKGAEGEDIFFFRNSDEEIICYESPEAALHIALSIASLSEDTPMVEGKLITEY